LPSSRARSPRADASPAMEARSSRTARYSSTSLASSSRAWASCVLMSAPLGGEGGGALGPAPWCGPVPGPRGGPLRRQLPPRSPGRWRARQSTPAWGRSSWRWSCRSSRTSSPRRRGTPGISPGPARQRSPTPRTRAKWRVAVRWWSRGMTHRRWWRRGSQPPGRGDRDGPRVPPHRRWWIKRAPSRRRASRGGTAARKPHAPPSERLPSC
jgi:hypothetical protein